MPTPMPSASNSCAREKLAIVSFVFASASAVRSGSLLMSVTTRVTTAACRAWSSRIEACFAMHMRHLVAQHRGQFRGVAGKRDQAARHIELAGRQREGVDRAGIEDRHPVGLVGTVGGRDQPVDGLADQGRQPRIVIGAAIGGENALMFALARRRLRDGAARLRRRHRRRGGLEFSQISTGGKRQRRAQQRRRSQEAAARVSFAPFCTMRQISHWTTIRLESSISSLFCA